MAEYLSPGVYVEEVASGGKPMEGVSTSTAGFVGMTLRGPLTGTPEFVGSFMEFRRKFGGYLPRETYGERRYLPMAVEQFFANGGSRCFVVRLLGAGAAPAKATTGAGVFAAANPGAWGNRVTITCRPHAMDAKLCSLQVSCRDSDRSEQADYEELYNDVSLDPAAEGYVVRLLERSLLVRIELKDGLDAAKSLYDLLKPAESTSDKAPGDTPPDDAKAPPKLPVTVTLDGGADWGAGKKEPGDKSEDAPQDKTEAKKPDDLIDAAVLKGVDDGPGKRSGLAALLDVPEVSIVAAPGCVKDAEIQALVTHCENTLNRVCILDMPAGENSVTALQAFRAKVDSSYAAMYHPWIQVFDPLEKRPVYLPPSGAMAGIYARTDTTRGVHKAPANETVRNCTGLETLFGKAEQDMLNPVGVNLIRSIPGQGVRVWGARTCSSDPVWKYINVRRLFIFLEESIRRNTGWAVFEPNDTMLWTKVYNSISSFLGTQWRNGALAGASEGDAFFVSVGLGSSMTQDDVNNGRLICIIGVAPVRPAEFVIFRISQLMESK